MIQEIKSVALNLRRMCHLDLTRMYYIVLLGGMKLKKDIVYQECIVLSVDISVDWGIGFQFICLG